MGAHANARTHIATPTTANVHGDNKAGMQALARHLLRDHGYPTLAYLGGYADSPDSIERREVLAAEVTAVDITGSSFTMHHQGRAAAARIAIPGPFWVENFLAAFRLSQGARRVIKQNLFISLATVAVLVGFAILGRIPLTLGVLGHEGSTVIVVLNSLRLLLMRAEKPSPEND